MTQNVEVVRGCTRLGEISASDRMNGGMVGQAAAEENSWRRLKNKAAEMGATTVLMTTDNVTTSGARHRGEAYRCESATAQPGK